MMGEPNLGKSEAVENISGMWKKYKDFCFGIMSKLPYDSVKSWNTFSDGDVEGALKKKQSVGKSIKDYYAITAIGWLASIIAFWPVWLAYFALLGSVFGFLALISSASYGLGPLGLIALAIIIAVLVLPVISLLVSAAVHHIIAKLLGGKGSFAQTLSTVVNASAAGLILSIPIYALYAIIIGYLLSPLLYVIMIYMVYLEYRGFRHVHAISRNRGIAVLIGEWILSSIIWMALAAGIIIIITGSSGVARLMGLTGA